MTNNELLLAISDMMDTKLKAELQPTKQEQTRINVIIENEIRNDIIKKVVSERSGKLKKIS